MSPLHLVAAILESSTAEEPQGGYADNVTVFANVTFPGSGNYVIQTLINSNVFAEQALIVCDVSQQQTVVSSETIQ